MAMIKCPKCGKEYHDAVIVCPSCGFNPFAENAENVFHEDHIGHLSNSNSFPENEDKELTPQETQNSQVFQVPQGHKMPRGKSKTLAGILCFLFWSVGAHELYLGSIPKALLCICAGTIINIISMAIPPFRTITLIVAIIWSIMIFSMPKDKFDAKYNSPTSPKTKTGCLIVMLIIGILMAMMFAAVFFILLQSFK